MLLTQLGSKIEETFKTAVNFQTTLLKRKKGRKAERQKGRKAERKKGRKEEKGRKEGGKEGRKKERGREKERKRKRERKKGRKKEIFNIYVQSQSNVIGSQRGSALF